MQSECSLSSRLEDYIEAIYVISHNNKVARVTDVSKKLNVRRSSVTGALKTLVSMDIVNHSPYGYITLTDKGERLGMEMVRRHEVIKDFLVEVLGIEESKADKTACLVEHSMDTSIMEKLVELIDFIRRCPKRAERKFSINEEKTSPSNVEKRCFSCDGTMLGKIASWKPEERSRS